MLIIKPLIHWGGQEETKPKNLLLEVSGSLAALILKEQFEQGEEISIPSLGLTIKKEQDDKKKHNETK